MEPVRHPLPRPVVCDACRGNDIALIHHGIIYGKTFGDWPLVWYCWGCKALVGCHKGTDIPLGTMADKKTRQARKHCHEVFDKLWQDGPFSRTEAYAWLRGMLGLTAEQCHISRFDAAQAQRAAELSIQKRREINDHSRQAARRRKQRARG